MASKAKPATLTVVFRSDCPDLVVDLAANTDWAVFAEDILEVKKPDGSTTYIPIDRIREWSLQPK